MKNQLFYIVGAAIVVIAALCIKPLTTKVQDDYKPVHLSSLYSKMKLTIHQPYGMDTSSIGETWYVAPGMLRQDMIDGEDRTVNIVRNNLSIDFITGGQAAVYIPTSAKDWEKFRELTDSCSAADVIKAFGSKGRIAGKRTILGRTCDMVELPESGGCRTTYCIDRKTGVALTCSTTRADKTKVDNIATVFEVDKNIPNSIFNPVIPKGMLTVRAPFRSEGIMLLTFPRVINIPDLGFSSKHPDVRNLPDQSMAAAEIRKLLKEDKDRGRKSSLAGLYAPSYIPSNFRLLRVDIHSTKNVTRNGWSTRTSYNDKSYNGISINYLDSKAGNVLILMESSELQESDSAAVAISGFDGKVLTKTDPFPYSILTWEKDGVHFKLGAVNLPEAELVRIAKSINPVK